MEDLFILYDRVTQKYHDQNNMYAYYQNESGELLFQMFQSILEFYHKLEDTCLEYLDLFQYMNEIEEDFCNSKKAFFKEKKELFVEAYQNEKLKEELKRRILFYSNISIDSLINLLSLLTCSYYILNDGCLIIEDGENYHTLPLSSIQIPLISFLGDEMQFNPIFYSILGENMEEFIRFYVNSQNEVGERIPIEEAWKQYSRELELV